MGLVHTQLNWFGKGALAALLVFVLSISTLGAICVSPTNAYAQTGLTVYVGYSGGPYYVKKTYSDAQIQALSSNTVYKYTALDNMPSLRQFMGRGVTLTALAADCGINADAVSRFHFITSDSYKTDDGLSGTTGWSYNQLIGTTRYYYPNFVDYYSNVADGLSSTEKQAISASGVVVETILAYDSYDFRVTDAASAAQWDDTTLMDGQKRYRLLFGQSNPSEVNANLMSSGVTGVIFVLDGKPTISQPSQDFSGKVGDTFTFTPTLNASDSTVSANGIKDITWYSTNPEAATVEVNADGSVTVTIVGNGSFQIRGTYGNSSSSAYVASTSAGKGTGTGGTNAPVSSIEALGLVGSNVYLLTSGGSYSNDSGSGGSAGESGDDFEVFTYDEELAKNTPAAPLVATAAAALVIIGAVVRIRMFNKAKDPTV